MNKKSTKLIMWVLVPTLLLAFASCKKSSTTDDPTTNNPVPEVKKLDKTTLTPKKWYTEGSSTIHDFKANNLYASMGGTWFWKNATSDTMKIITKSGFPEVEWKFYYNTTHEMKCENLTNHVAQLYRDTAW